MAKPNGETERTIEVPVAAIVELFAALDATADVLIAFAGGQDHEGAWHFASVGANVDRQLGISPDSDDPTRVAIEARSAEITADVLESIGERAALYRESARRIREAGTTDVPSPWTEGGER